MQETEAKIEVSGCLERPVVGKNTCTGERGTHMRRFFSEYHARGRCVFRRRARVGEEEPHVGNEAERERGMRGKRGLSFHVISCHIK